MVVGDFDADGRSDLIQANGHVLDRARLGTPFAMRPTALHQTGERFEDVSELAGDWFRRPILGRGLAIGDLDGDGRPDLVANALDVPAAILRNVSVGGHRLALEIIDRSGHPAVGARVRVTAGGRTLVAAVVAGGSYLSASAPLLYFGLGTAESVDKVEVDWPWEKRSAGSSPRQRPTLICESSKELDMSIRDPRVIMLQLVFLEEPKNHVAIGRS